MACFVAAQSRGGLCRSHGRKAVTVCARQWTAVVPCSGFRTHGRQPVHQPRAASVPRLTAQPRTTCGGYQCCAAARGAAYLSPGPFQRTTTLNSSTIRVGGDDELPITATISITLPANSSAWAIQPHLLHLLPLRALSRHVHAHACSQVAANHAHLFCCPPASSSTPRCTPPMPSTWPPGATLVSTVSC
jgi:hypothetical protein